MSWLRTDDTEVLDDRIGDLADREYRSWHALLQYIEREANEDGIIHETRVKRAAFVTPTGTKSVTKRDISHFKNLELLEDVSGISDDRLKELKIPRPEGHGWLRPTNWERFNPPRDRTNAERQRRYRETLRNGQRNALHNGPSAAPVTDETRARARTRRDVDVEQEQDQDPATAIAEDTRENGAHTTTTNAEVAQEITASLVQAGRSPSAETNPDDDPADREKP